jgi:GTP-binding protein
MADIPGLIPGAHAGKGLGIQFLKHVERTRVLVHVLDLGVEEAGRSPWSDFVALNHELACFNPTLAQTPQLVVVNKLDLPAARQRFPAVQRCFAAHGYDIVPISAVTGEGLDVLLARLAAMLQPS